mmetsp:Transcript_13189/g.41618  ORF Transcript_13189/g.41618 Transcript_13189/m.41618 type:complete len:281 (-) Transcript_13189:1743-2585(-)
MRRRELLHPLPPVGPPVKVDEEGDTVPQPRPGRQRRRPRGGRRVLLRRRHLLGPRRRGAGGRRHSLLGGGGGVVRSPGDLRLWLRAVYLGRWPGARFARRGLAQFLAAAAAEATPLQRPRQPRAAAEPAGALRSLLEPQVRHELGDQLAALLLLAVRGDVQTPLLAVLQQLLERQRLPCQQCLEGLEAVRALHAPLLLEAFLHVGLQQVRLVHVLELRVELNDLADVLHDGDALRLEAPGLPGLHAVVEEQPVHQRVLLLVLVALADVLDGHASLLTLLL